MSPGRALWQRYSVGKQPPPKGDAGKCWLDNIPGFLQGQARAYPTPRLSCLLPQDQDFPPPHQSQDPEVWVWPSQLMHCPRKIFSHGFSLSF